MEQVILKTNHLTKRYGHRAVVENLSMTIYKGDIYGFIGKNGAGKTTLIRMVTGLAAPSDGSIQLFGSDSLLEGRRRIGTVIEAPAFYPGMTARENIVAGTRCMNVGQRDNRGGMAYCESRARDYLDSHPNGWLYYAVTPAYEGSEPICRGLWIDMRSDDASIDQRVFVFNAANGYQIDYTGASTTGYSSTTVEAVSAEPAPEQTPTQGAGTAGPENPSVTYILNTNTGKFQCTATMRT